MQILCTVDRMYHVPLQGGKREEAKDFRTLLELMGNDDTITGGHFTVTHSTLGRHRKLKR